MNAISSHESASRCRSRWDLRAVLATAATGLALAAASAPVIAGTSNLTVDVVSALTPPPLPDVVSPSAPACPFPIPATAKGCTIAAYAVSIGNDTSSNVSNAWFKATTYVFDGPGDTAKKTSIKAQFLDVPANCSKSADSTTIACNIGQVAAGGGTFPTFIVTVHSPQVPGKNHEIRMAWDIPSGQGASGSLSPVSSSTAIPGEAVTLIGDPPTPTKATTRSWVTTAAELYTGNDDIATAANLATVKVTLPKAPDTKVATITSEVTTTAFCTTSDFPKCVEYTLDIPGTFETEGYLKIVVQRDASTIKNGAKPENVLLKHDGLEIRNCDPGDVIPAPAINFAPNHCISLREELPKNAGKDLKGDFRITVYGRTNGKISW